jgi:hypothetical protein
MGVSVGISNPAVTTDDAAELLGGGNGRFTRFSTVLRLARLASCVRKSSPFPNAIADNGGGGAIAWMPMARSNKALSFREGNRFDSFLLSPDPSPAHEEDALDDEAAADDEEEEENDEKDVDVDRIDDDGRISRSNRIVFALLRNGASISSGNKQVRCNIN